MLEILVKYCTSGFLSRGNARWQRFYTEVAVVIYCQMSNCPSVVTTPSPILFSTPSCISTATRFLARGELSESCHTSVIPSSLRRMATSDCRSHDGTSSSTLPSPSKSPVCFASAHPPSTLVVATRFCFGHSLSRVACNTRWFHRYPQKASDCCGRSLCFIGHVFGPTARRAQNSQYADAITPHQTCLPADPADRRISADCRVVGPDPVFWRSHRYHCDAHQPGRESQYPCHYAYESSEHADAGANTDSRPHRHSIRDPYRNPITNIARSPRRPRAGRRVAVCCARGISAHGPTPDSFSGFTYLGRGAVLLAIVQVRHRGRKCGGGMRPLCIVATVVPDHIQNQAA